MKHTDRSIFMTALAFLALVGVTSVSWADTPPATNTTDDFTQASDSNSWKTFDGACLTAGDGTGSIPACIGLPYYKNQVQVGGASGFLGSSTSPASGMDTGQLPDPVGKGALRFTNGHTAGYRGFAYGYNQAGGIISSGTPFPTGAGLQVIFKTITYRGDSGNGDGADGMGFFLMDGTVPPYDTGAFGGSLGYTCSNNNNDPSIRGDFTPRGYDGLVGGYVGLGIDEYGNFLNAGDNTASGPNQTPGRIGMRGRGSISWGWLHANYPTQYPSALVTILDASYGTKARAAVRDTCRTGYIWDYSNVTDSGDSGRKTGTAVNDYQAFGNSVVLSTLLPGKNIAQENAVTRTDGTPITYNLKITQDGILSLYISYGGGSYQPVIPKQSITASNGALPSSFRFGFTGSNGGSNNIHEILCFQAAPADLAGTSVGVNQQEATKIATGTQAYLAYYYPSNWTGRMTANDLLYFPPTSTTPPSIGVKTTANWDASCNLTGVPAGQTCPSTLTAGLTNPQAPASRTLLTWDGSNGVAFEWDTSAAGSKISGAEAGFLDAGDLLPINANRLQFLRGDRTNEINTTTGVGLFRPRDGVLGDIVDSSPTWVGPPSSPYAVTWKDLLNSGDSLTENTGTQTFSQFIAAAKTRLNVVYAGSNDGFVHGFETGAYDSSGVYLNNSTYPNDGKEVLAYMPRAVLNKIHSAIDGTVDYAGSQYSHSFYVDATPDQDDLFYNKTWHTWMVGGLGAGGNAIYMLDVTDPSAFSESNAKNLVMGEWDNTTISCANDAGLSLCANSLGNTYGTPIVRRLHDGNWAVIFGNGFNSTSGDAGIFVMLIDSNGKTSPSSTYYLSTGKTGTNDGIAYVTAVDFDGDHMTDYVYAGDLLGNLWRFDLTGATETSWAVTAGGPLFTASSGQPITTEVEVVGVAQTSGPARIMVDFGTGRKFPLTNLSGTTYATAAQSLYGVWDSNFTSWNAKSSTKFLSLGSASTLTATNLTAQTLTVNADSSLDVTSNVVCWSGSTACGSGNNKFGFSVALPASQEQLVYNPLIFQGALIVNTTIPASNSPTSCQVAHDKGNTIALSLLSGGALGSSTGGTFFKNTTDTASAGSGTNGTGTPFPITAGGNTFIITQTLGDGAFSTGGSGGGGGGGGGGGDGGGGGGGPFTCPAGSKLCSGWISGSNVSSKRLTWIQRR